MQTSLVPNAWANKVCLKITLVSDCVFVPKWLACSLISSCKDVAVTLKREQHKRVAREICKLPVLLWYLYCVHWLLLDQAGNALKINIHDKWVCGTETNSWVLSPQSSYHALFCWMWVGTAQREYALVPSSRTDFFVDISGQNSFRRRQLSTKQWSGNKQYIIMSTKQNLCRQVVFSQNCCFVTNFVDKALVDDSTNVHSLKFGTLKLLCLRSELPLSQFHVPCWSLK